MDQGKVKEAQLKKDDLDRERLISDFASSAAAAYKQILTRYPVMERSDDAKARLLALHQEVPRPTKAMLAQNKAEEAARHEKSMLSDVTGILSKRPDVSAATNVGNPTLQDQEPVSPTSIVEAANRVAAGSKPAEHSLTGAIIGTGTPAENQPAPRSDDPAAPAAKATADQTPAGQEDPNELKTIGSEANADANAPPDPNELKPNVAPDTPAPAPQQVNELGQNTGDPNAQAATKPDASGQELADDQMISSSKHKKKKGLSKIIPGGK
jgi:hypothetical protein